jgi:hypothetical protein
MFRLVPLALAVAGLLTLGTLTTEAAGKKKKPITVVGTIKAVNDGGKLITVAVKVKKKNKDTVVPDKEIKVGDKTKIEYVGIDAKEDQVLKVGHAVTITLDEKSTDSAASIKVSKAKKKKKKKTDA